MFIAIVAGLLLAFAAPLLYRLSGRFIAIPMVLFPVVLFGYFCTFLLPVLAGQTIENTYQWVPALGINLHFYLDGLGLFFALLITGFGALIMLFAGKYQQGHPLLGRFYLYLTLFMTAMLGIVISGNIFMLFIFWELTSLSSYLLIGFSHEKEEARKSALQALLVTGSGGLALMAGLILISLAANTSVLSELLVSNHLITSHSWYVPAVLLILAGAFTKSAQFPFHFWLPNAMVAPTSVSAYLHSATMVKAGVFLLARLSPAMGGTELWQYSLIIAGAATAVLGAWLALQHTDLKAILAYTTISALGILVMLTGLGTAPALQAMLVFLLAHALYKGTLFLVAGILDHNTGTRNLDLLEGLGKKMPFTAVAATLAALSMAGFLPLFGFIGKELLYEATLHAGSVRTIVLGAAFFSGIAFVTVALFLGYRIFWQKSNNPTSLLHPETWALYLPPVVLAASGLVLGLGANFLAAPLLGRAVQAVLVEAPVLKLALWHGFTPVLGLSAATILAGLLVFQVAGRIRRSSDLFSPLYKAGPANLYQLALQGLLSGATRLTSGVQNGYLRNYIGVIIFTLVCLIGAVLFKWNPALNLENRLHQFTDVRLYELVVLLLIFPALIFLFRTNSRLTSIAMLGMIGYAVALIFILFGAPDVAATQLLIETLTVVLFVFLLHKLPAFRSLQYREFKFKYVFLSGLFGTLMTYVLLLVKGYTAPSELKAYYGANSYLLGKGHNMVNVILVDFRALDTLGEIVVLVVAATGIYAMLKLRLEKGDKI